MNSQGEARPHPSSGNKAEGERVIGYCSVHEQKKVSPIIDSDAEELKRIRAEKTTILETLREMEREYIQTRQPYCDRLKVLSKREMLLGPKPKCFAVQKDLGPACDECPVWYPCYQAMMTRRGAA